MTFTSAPRRASRETRRSASSTSTTSSLAQIGQWPWPRTIVAQLVDRLAAAGAAVVAFDIDFAEPDRTSPKLLLPLIAQNGVARRRRRKAAVEPARSRSGSGGGDAQGPGGDRLYPDRPRRDAGRRPRRRGLPLPATDPLGHVDDFPAAVPNLPELEAAAAGDGFLNQYLDWDHVVRRVPLILKLNGKPYPSLAAEALRVAFGASTYVGARRRRQRREAILARTPGSPRLRIGPLTVPTDAAGRVWLYYARREPDRTLSAADVLAGKFDPALVAGHIVLVGTSAAGVDQRPPGDPAVAAPCPGSRSTPS